MKEPPRMTEKIIQLVPKGPEKRERNAEAIALLKQCLADAESGEVQAVAIVEVRPYLHGKGWRWVVHRAYGISMGVQHAFAAGVLALHSLHGGDLVKYSGALDEPGKNPDDPDDPPPAA